MDEFRFPGSPPDFDCAICRRHINNRFPGARQAWAMHPVCRYCETEYGGRPPMRGAFRDRRIAVQIIALAEALETEARVQHYGRYGYAAERL